MFSFLKVLTCSGVQFVPAALSQVKKVEEGERNLSSISVYFLGWNISKYASVLPRVVFRSRCSVTHKLNVCLTFCQSEANDV